MNLHLFSKISLIFCCLCLIGFSHIVSAQHLRLVIGDYECTTNAQCGDNQYCDIDTHTCISLPEYPVCDVCEECDTCEVCEECGVCLPTNPCPSDMTWNDVKKACICPTNKPILNETTGICESCTTDSQCPSNQICSGGKCICPGLKDWDETEGKCICKYVPEGGDGETCECPSGQDDVNGVCDTACPTSTGFTGKRNADKICTCDTTKGYAEIPVDNGTRCACDESRNYYDKPDGTCMQCKRTTKEWCYNKGLNKDQAHLVDCKSMDEDVWFCGYYKRTTDDVGRLYYNPTTNGYCNVHQVLKKDSNMLFYCAECSTVPAADLGYCGCRLGTKWNGTECVAVCNTSPYLHLINGICSVSPDVWSFDNKTKAGGPSCNGVPAWTAGSEVFNYWRWVNNTSSTCHPNATDGKSGRYPQTDGGECDYRKGCMYVSENLPACTVGTKITDTCTCGTGGSAGQYCCAATAYPTSGGCVTCSGNTVPNTNRNGCESCPANTIVQNGKCVTCDVGYIPSANQLRCYACPDGKTTDETGTACVAIEETQTEAS